MNCDQLEATMHRMRINILLACPSGFILPEFITACIGLTCIVILYGTCPVCMLTSIFHTSDMSSLLMFIFLNFFYLGIFLKYFFIFYFFNILTSK